ncbi:MAG TPA: glucose-1-phosphate cytidylyltransferase [Cyanobacteria bacterium UBA11369]|nr:glucose-1-phosphate cytidylyltransferase [Cyanobacteria bacterium UBA11371]HBE33515.1 glucose-1-phosphate cytidylyltransferase [Cyanobacteria bacterium UBA11368]HBE54337.1 glucose-1-phosphate cytidylyltransferase [Cyanobacteria bacterium UBA11369]
MKVALLAGGLGTRLAEETEVKPKPMVEIGGKPILWHIMMHYSHYGFNNFAIALGYKGEVIKKYMVDYCSLNSNLTVNFQTGAVTMQGGHRPSWTVELVDTGINSLTGGRIKRLAPHIGNETFMATYGDGVSDVNLHDLLAFHKSHGKLVTLTVVHPPARFGHLELDDNQVIEFSEKPQTREGWINSGFFVLEPEIFDYIDSDETYWEKEPLERLAREGQVMAYKHTSFWQCMDTIRDKKLLETLWQTGNAPWKMWEEENANLGNGTQGVHRDNDGAHVVSGRA